MKERPPERGWVGVGEGSFYQQRLFFFFLKCQKKNAILYRNGVEKQLAQIAERCKNDIPKYAAKLFTKVIFLFNQKQIPSEFSLKK